MEFPQYRSISNESSIYLILSLDHFIEYQKIGKYFTQMDIQAIQYPEKLRIMDMIKNPENKFKLLSKNEFDALLKNWENNLIRKDV